MKAIAITRLGGPEVLELIDAPEPELGPRDLLVQVAAFAVNPVDAKLRRGLRGRPLPPGGLVVGYDAAGVVVSAGPQASLFKPGDAVFFAGDLNRPGCYAERVAVDERLVARKPRACSFEQAASLPMASLTAWEGLVENLGFTEEQGEGKNLLVIGGAGGVGSIALQLAKNVCGFRVVATASRPESNELCRRLGAWAVLDHSRSLPAQLPVGGVTAFDVIFSCAETNDFLALADLLQPLGKVCCILPSSNADLSGLFRKRGTVSFEWMGARTAFDAEPERQGRALDRVAELVDRGLLSAAVTRVMDWKDIHEAHRAIDTGHTLGKVVLRVPTP